MSSPRGKTGGKQKTITGGERGRAKGAFKGKTNEENGKRERNGASLLTEITEERGRTNTRQWGGSSERGIGVLTGGRWLECQVVRARHPRGREG